MTKFKLYFWNGFGNPELVATSLTGVLRDLHVSDNYLGDVTPDIRALVREYKASQTSKGWDNLIEELEGYNLYMNPTYNTFKNVAQQWFDDTPSNLLKEFA